MHLQELYFFNFILLIPEFFLIISIFIFLIFGIYFKNNNYKILNNCIIYQLILLFILKLNNLNITYILANSLFIYDSFIKNIGLFLIFTTILYFFFSKQYLINQKITFFENSILILISLFSLLFLIMSYNFLSLYLTLELQSLCFYVLTLSQRKSLFSAEASLKYFILGSIASSLFLFGVSFIYGTLGTLNFGQIYLIFSNLFIINNIYLLISFLFGFLFVLSGLFFKLGSAPFHIWLPDVYEGSPNNITFFFALVPKIGLLSIIIRIFFDVLINFTFFFENFLFICILSSLAIGSFFALKQKKIKRLLAYSSINHIGFIFLGFLNVSYDNLIYILLYIIIYTFMNINIWGIYISIFINNYPLKYITDFTNLIKYNKTITYIIGLNLFSMAGIPPFAGFFIKFFIIFKLLKSSFFSLSFLVILFSVLSCFYYLRMIKIIFFDQKKIKFLNNFTKINSFLILIFSKIICFFILYPRPLLTYILFLNLSFFI